MHSPTTGPNKNDQTGAGDDIRNQPLTPPNERGQNAAASKNLSRQHNGGDESAAGESGVEGELVPQNPSASKLETTTKEDYEDGTWDVSPYYLQFGAMLITCFTSETALREQPCLMPVYR